MEEIAASDWRAGAGRLAGTSEWMTVSQRMIDTFADASHDHQFIHVDVERAKAETPFGGTIAHGFLTLSLLSKMVVEALPPVAEARISINYGFDRIRFLSPVPADAKVRGHFRLTEVSERKPGEFLSKYDVTVEIEGVDKPALSAEWLGMTILNSTDQGDDFE
ncbi:MAG: MaoC family dehydratase [Nitratireductor sp.]|nr:MaoC family dehydratase [Nitratireductor sp.]